MNIGGVATFATIARRHGISTPPIVKLLNSISRLWREPPTPVRLRRNWICGARRTDAFRGAAGQNSSLGAGIQDQLEGSAIGQHGDEREAVCVLQRDRSV